MNPGLEIKVIGIGGIGCALLPFLCRYLTSEGERARITLVDGDAFESRNAARQSFERLGNKAKVKAEELAREFPTLSFRAIPEYVTGENVEEIIREGEIIFLAVDNHRTRLLVGSRGEALQDILLISGGNDLTSGNVQVHLKQGGKDLTLPLTAFHPEIQDPEDRSPSEMSCEELQQASAPQLLFMNLTVACFMLNAFYAWRIGRLDYDEVYFDIVEGRAQPVRRHREGGDG